MNTFNFVDPSLNSNSRKENIKMNTININETFATINEVRYILEVEELPLELARDIGNKTDVALEVMVSASQGDRNSIDQINELVDEFKSFIDNPQNYNPEEELEMKEQNVFTNELELLDTLKKELSAATQRKLEVFAEYEGYEAGHPKRLELMKMYSFYMEEEVKLETEIANRLIAIADAELEVHESLNSDDVEEPEKEVESVREYDHELAKLIREINNHEKQQVKEVETEPTDTVEESSVFSMKRSDIIQDEIFIEDSTVEDTEEPSIFSMKGSDIIQDDFIRDSSTESESVNEDTIPETDEFDDRGRLNDLKDEAEIAFEKSSRVVRGKVNKGVSAVKKAEKKFGKFMGEFLVKSAMKGARK